MEVQKMWTMIYPVYKDPQGIKNSENASHEVAVRYETKDEICEFLMEHTDIDMDEVLVIPPTVEFTGADLFIDTVVESVNEHEKWLELAKALQEIGYTPPNVVTRIADSHSSDANHSSHAGEYHYHTRRVDELYQLVKRLN